MRSPSDGTGSTKEAAAIRRLVPRLAQLAAETPQDREAHEAVALLRHLRPGRAEDAALAYLVFERRIRRELATCAGIQEEYASLLNRLVNYLELEGREWLQGRGWVPTAEAWPAGGVRLASAG